MNFAKNTILDTKKLMQEHQVSIKEVKKTTFRSGGEPWKSPLVTDTIPMPAAASLKRTSFAEIPYGEVHHLQGRDEDEKHSFVFQNIYHIGDTKSAQELEVFLRMSRKRLRLCCGLQCTDRLHPNGPRQRQKLYTAALKLLWFAVAIDSVQCENAAQVALHAAIWPLLRLEDGHVLATLSAIVLALYEGRTGLAISGVFGAGKTRSAAVLLAGLLVFDPSLKLMGKYCSPCRC